MNTWKLDDETRNKIKPIVIDSIRKAKENDEYTELDLTFEGISPYQLKELVEELGYIEYDSESNGWEMDFWIYFVNKNEHDITRKLNIRGCGMSFKLTLQIGE